MGITSTAEAMREQGARQINSGNLLRAGLRLPAHDPAMRASAASDVGPDQVQVGAEDEDPGFDPGRLPDPELGGAGSGSGGGASCPCAPTGRTSPSSSGASPCPCGSIAPKAFDSPKSSRVDWNPSDAIASGTLAARGVLRTSPSWSCSAPGDDAGRTHAVRGQDGPGRGGSRHV